MNFLIFKKLADMFLTKKRVIGWISAVAIALGAAAAGMQSTEFKEAVCGAPVIEKIEAPAPQAAPQPEKK